jgi:hypothetical protein
LSENLRLLQIFIGINVRLVFLLRGLAGFFGASGFGDGLRIGLRILSTQARGHQRSGRAEIESYTEAEWPAGGPSR